MIEPRMTGLMLLSDPPTREHLRFRWQFAPTALRDAISLWFWDRRGLGTIRLLAAGELEAKLAPPFLGPDALAMSSDDWPAALGRTRRAVKIALLDQRLIAGIGNLYASEILHLARINPETPASRLRRRQFERLAAATQTVLQTAIRYEGSTLSDGTYRNALNEDGRYQNEHRVYDREGERCPTCSRSVIRRIVQAQRSTFFCPLCQRRPSSRENSR